MEINDGPAATLHGEPEHYTGDVWQDPLAAPGDGTGFSMQRVHFSPGAHTNWHRHPRGQVLTVIDGVGRIQARGGEVRTIRAGETAICPAGEWHWHGAGPDTMMTMIGVQAADDDGSFVIWGDRVLDERAVAGDRAPHHQGVDLPGALVGVDRLGVRDETPDLVL